MKGQDACNLVLNSSPYKYKMYLYTHAHAHICAQIYGESNVNW